MIIIFLKGHIILIRNDVAFVYVLPELNGVFHGYF